MSTKRKPISFPDIQFQDDPRLARLMEFVRAQALELQALTQLLRAGTAGQVLEKSSSTDYDGTWKDGGGGAITGAENIGTGEGLFAETVGTVLAFKTLVQGANITLTVGADTITITAAGSGGGGSGTVTSVGIASSDLDVAGSPISTSGDIILSIGAHKVTYAKIQQPSTDGVVLGRKQGDGVGDFEELNGADILAMAGGGGYSKQLAYAGIV